MVSRNVSKARGRLGLEAAIWDAGGNVIEEPADNEIAPTVSIDASLANAPSRALDPTWTQIGNPQHPGTRGAGCTLGCSGLEDA